MDERTVNRSPLQGPISEDEYERMLEASDG